MDLNRILNTDTAWKGGCSSLQHPGPMVFTHGSHDFAIHQKSHQVNTYSLRPQSEHKRNDTVYSLPSQPSSDVPLRSLSRLDVGLHQYESEQLCRSFARYSASRQSDLNGVQPANSFKPTTYAFTNNSSLDNSLTLGTLHIRPARSVFDPSFSFRGAHTDHHQEYHTAIVTGGSSMATTSHGQGTACRSVESIPSNDSSTECSPMTMSMPLPVINAEAVPVRGPKTCCFLDKCSTESPERKVTSHIFGRNKNCTKQIPDAIWLWYCRKHYQRCRYRSRPAFTKHQLDSVRIQVDRLEVWGGVLEWEIILKKSERERLDRENAELAKIALGGCSGSNDGGVGGDNRYKEAGPSQPMAFFEAESPASLVRKQTQSIDKDQDDRACHDVALDGDDEDDEGNNSKGSNKDQKNKSKNKNKNKNKNKVAKKTKKKMEELPVCRWMVPYCGKAKTFADVRVVLDLVDNYIERNMERDNLVFPHIEILPHSTPSALPRRAARTTQRRCNPQLKASVKRKAPDSTSESGDMTPPTSRKRRSLAEDNSDESGGTSTARPRKRRAMAGGNTNEASTVLPPKRRSATGGNKQSKATPRSPPKRRTLARGRKTQPAAMSAIKQGKQAIKNTPASGGRRR